MGTKILRHRMMKFNIPFSGISSLVSCRSPRLISSTNRHIVSIILSHFCHFICYFFSPLVMILYIEPLPTPCYFWVSSKFLGLGFHIWESCKGLRSFRSIFKIYCNSILCLLICLTGSCGYSHTMIGLSLRWLLT